MCETPDLGNHAITDGPARWTAACKDSLFHQSDNTWTAFTQDSSDERQDVVGQWWPTSAVEESRDGAFTNQNVVNLNLRHSAEIRPPDLGISASFVLINHSRVKKRLPRCHLKTFYLLLLNYK